jgi:hypothetical protein
MKEIDLAHELLKKAEQDLQPPIDLTDIIRQVENVVQKAGMRNK